MSDIDEMSREDILSEIEWMEDGFRRCEDIGQGISSKETVKFARLKAALVMTGAEAGLLTNQQIAILRMEYQRIDTIDPSAPTYSRLCAMLDAMPDRLLRQVADADIKFMSLLALNRCIRRGI